MVSIKTQFFLYFFRKQHFCPKISFFRMFYSCEDLQCVWGMANHIFDTVSIDPDDEQHQKSTNTTPRTSIPAKRATIHKTLPAKQADSIDGLRIRSNLIEKWSFFCFFFIFSKIFIKDPSHWLWQLTNPAPAWVLKIQTHSWPFALYANRVSSSRGKKTVWLDRQVGKVPRARYGTGKR